MLPEKFNLRIKDVGKVISKMIGDFNIEEIENFLDENSKLKEKITLGSLRIIKQNENIVKKRISTFVTSENLTDLFFIWYGKQGASRKYLDDYFTSEEYKLIYPDEKKNQVIFHLNDQKFLELMAILKPDESIYYLLFSPILFETPQAHILENTWFNYVELCENSQNKQTELLEEKESLQNYILSIKSDLRKIEKEKSKLEDTIRTLQLQQKNNISDELKTKIDKIKNENSSELIKLTSELDHLKEELRVSNNNCSELHKDYEKLENKYKIIENQNLNLQRKLENLREEKEKHFTAVISHLDIFELLNSINEPDEIKDFLRSCLIQTDTDKTISENAFEDFWKKCEEIEKNNINKIKEIMISDVLKSGFIDRWDGDLFKDIKYSLTARSYIINLLYEIMRENVEKLYESGKT